MALLKWVQRPHILQTKLMLLSKINDNSHLCWKIVMKVSGREYPLSYSKF